MKRFLIAAALSCAMLTAGCQTVGNLVQTTTTASPKQATTLAGAVQLADLATVATDKYVTAGMPSRAVLLKLQSLRAEVRKAVDNLVAANAAGQSLTFAAVNSAYAAFQSYAVTNGVKL